VQAITIARNELVPGANGAITARRTEVTETIDADLVLRSIGYRGSPVPGLPFDERRAVIHNDGGRVTFPKTNEPVPGVYAAGWIKRGPSGVIGTNKKCAQETVALLLDDLAAGMLPEPSGSAEAFAELLAERHSDRIGYDGWQAIDAHERALGEAQGRPRVKLTRTEDLLRVARAQQPAAR
jgi:ferredoxin--NADP+ reductase